MKTIKLILVSESNNNKFYNMNQIDNSNFIVEFGRVDSTSRKITYPMCLWDKTYKEKTKKGYTDITEFVKETIVKDLDVFNGLSTEIKNVIKFLLNSAKQKIADNYKISSASVTPAMINKAQEIITLLSNKITKLFETSDYNLSGESIVEINHELLELYKVIPRKMKNVKDHLIKSRTRDRIDRILIEEQSLLDTLAGQVTDNVIEDSPEAELVDSNILKDINVEIELIKDKKESDKVYSLFETNKSFIKNIYKIKNLNSEKDFNINNLKTNLLFHGSRNENWFNIIKTGLLIRPSCAQSTGSMFGNGIYFADKSQKSKGYTSCRGSYWSKGTSKKYFLAVYEVAVGKQKHIKIHNSSCYNLNYDSVNKEGFDSVFAHGGIDLKNNEFIIYKTNQCAIRYLIEMED